LPERTSDIWWLFSRQTVGITPRESLLRSALLMVDRNFRHLPVLDDGRIVGMISAQDIVDSLHLSLQSSSSANEVKSSLEIPVERVMSTNPFVVEHWDGIEEVIKKFCFYDVGAFPVVDQKGAIQGIITLRDLVGLVGISSTPLGVPVQEIMTTDLATIDFQAPLSRAVDLMSVRRVRRLPVMADGNRLSGMLTNKDILRQVLRVTSGGAGPSGFDRPVSDFMVKDIFTIGKDDDVRAAANMMMIFGIGGLIVRGPPSMTIGLVTERDLVRRLATGKSVLFLAKALQYEIEVEEEKSRSDRPNRGMT